MIRNRRQAKANGDFFCEPEGEVIVAVRIRGINGMSPKVKSILRLLRLRQIHNCVFVKVNSSALNMLRTVEPYIAYGYVTPKLVRELIYKRGFGKVNGSRIAISDNEVINQVLGEHGIKCVEDLVHEIVTVGPHFKEANNFLWPFKLSSPLGGYHGKLRHFNENGTFGMQEHLIKNLLRKMI